MSVVVIIDPRDAVVHARTTRRPADVEEIRFQADLPENNSAPTPWAGDTPYIFDLPLKITSEQRQGSPLGDPSLLGGGGGGGSAFFLCLNDICLGRDRHFSSATTTDSSADLSILAGSQLELARGLVGEHETTQIDV